MLGCSLIYLTQTPVSVNVRVLIYLTQPPVSVNVRVLADLPDPDPGVCQC